MSHCRGKKSADSPRGLSPLPIENRNEYSNLILLCAHHHTEIDKNEGDWAIELLHKIKTDHELWVEESLGTSLTPQDIVYSSIIDTITNALHLDQWNGFVSNAVRQFVPRQYVESWEIINERILAVVWPGTISDFENSAQALLKSYSDYIEYFLKYATVDDNGSFYKEDTYYKRIYDNPDYHFISDRNSIWVRKSYLLLCLVTANLNDFAAKVREHINPLFYIEKGNFLILDELGTHGGGNGYLALPEKSSIEPMFADIDKEIENLKQEYPGKVNQL